MTRDHRPQPSLSQSRSWAGTSPLGLVVRHLRKHVAAQGLTGSTRKLGLVVAAVSVPLIAIVDLAIGSNFDLAVLYLLPIVGVTILMSPNTGLVFSALSAISWVIADAVQGPTGPLVGSSSNGLLRFLIFSAIVILVATLRDALADARTSDRRSRDFLAYAAHQLRTPLSSLGACAETLIMSGASADQERLLSVLASESHRIGRLVSSLLQIARLDEGVPRTVHPVDVVALCRSETNLIRERIGPGIDIRFDTEGAPAQSLMLDPDATREALANVLDNARRHACHRIDVTLTCSDHKVRVAVGDDGPGLPSGAEERAFERFVTLDNSGGIGLGLAIARALIELQGGRLAYEARRFVIELPAIGSRSTDATGTGSGKARVVLEMGTGAMGPVLRQ